MDPVNGASRRRAAWAFVFFGVLAIVFGTLALTLPSRHDGGGTARTAPPSRAPADDPACNATPGDHGKAPLRVVTDSRGAKFTYLHEDAPAGESWQVTPPPGFDPLTASDADLQTYLYPPRPNPNDTEAMALWRQVVVTPRSEPYECDTTGKNVAAR